MSEEQSEYDSSEEEEETQSESSEADQSKEDEDAEEEEGDDENVIKDVPTKEIDVEQPRPPAKTSTIQQEDHGEKQQQLPPKETGNNMRQNAHQQGQRKMTEGRKLNLKTLMLSKAREDLKVEAEHKAEEKKRVLNSRIEPLGNLNQMSENDLRELCRDLSGKIDKVDEQRYDLEIKVKKNDMEIEDLNQRIFDLRGKFKRPPLRRVRMSADQMLLALLGSKHKVSMDLRSNLKSIKKDEGKKEETKDWRENVEAKQGMSGKKAMFEHAEEE